MKTPKTLFVKMVVAVNVPKTPNEPLKIHVYTGDECFEEAEADSHADELDKFMKPAKKR
jgi:hypothetical protein